MNPLPKDLVTEASVWNDDEIAPVHDIDGVYLYEVILHKGETPAIREQRYAVAWKLPPDSGHKWTAYDATPRLFSGELNTSCPCPKALETLGLLFALIA